jgi:hypothetical protein
MELYPDLSDIGYEIELEAAGEAVITGKKEPAGNRVVLAEDVDLLQEIMEKEPGLKESLEQLVANGKAKGTMVNYNAAQARFQDFCMKQDYSFYEIEEKAVVHYVAELNKAQVSYATCQVKPAIVMMEEMYRGKAVAFTARADRILEGAKRVAAERRQPTRKAAAVNLDLLRRAVDKYVTPFRDNIHRIDVYKLRTIFRLVVEYFTFCRCSDFRKLQAKHVQRSGATVEFTFASSKNDQMHQGQTTVVTANGTSLCPVRLTELYFRRFGLRWGKEGADERYLHARIRKIGGTHVMDGRVAASTGKAREELKKLLEEMGVNSEGVTDKSFKMLGVTNTLEAGAPAEEVALHGRWRSTEMPLRYKHNSQEYKKRTAAKVPY